MEEERIKNYIILRNGMYKVKQDINQLIEIHDDLVTSLKQSLLINNNIIFEEELSENNKTINNIKSRINETIASINNKI